jgi:hypothetical protein
MYILLSSPWNLLPNGRHKASLSKFKKTEITPCILSAHNATEVELNKKNNSR